MADVKYDRALIGLSLDGRQVYDYDLLVSAIAYEEGCDEYEAAAWIDHNHTGVQDGPIIVQRKEDGRVHRYD